MQALGSGSQREIANLKNLLAREVEKAEQAKKQQLESEQIVADTIANILKLEQDFVEKEKTLIARAEKAKHELASPRTTYDNCMKILNQMVTCFFGKYELNTNP